MKKKINCSGMKYCLIQTYSTLCKLSAINEQINLKNCRNNNFEEIKKARLVRTKISAMSIIIYNLLIKKFAQTYLQNEVQKELDGFTFNKKQHLTGKKEN